MSQPVGGVSAGRTCHALPVITPQWPQYLCRWFCLLTLLFSLTLSGAISGRKYTAIVFAGGLSLAEYESAVAQAAVATPQVTTVHYTRGPDMGGGVRWTPKTGPVRKLG